MDLEKMDLEKAIGDIKIEELYDDSELVVEYKTQLAELSSINTFEYKTIDELLEDRRIARENKDYKLSDEIRNYLDSILVFVFDSTSGQEFIHLDKEFFKWQDGYSETSKMTKRQYVEYRLKQDRIAESTYDSWVYSTLKRKN